MYYCEDLFIFKVVSSMADDNDTLVDIQSIRVRKNNIQIMLPIFFKKKNSNHAILFCFVCTHKVIAA